MTFLTFYIRIRHVKAAWLKVFFVFIYLELTRKLPALKEETGGFVAS